MFYHFMTILYNSPQYSVFFVSTLGKKKYNMPLKKILASISLALPLEIYMDLLKFVKEIESVTWDIL